MLLNHRNFLLLEHANDVVEVVSLDLWPFIFAPFLWLDSRFGGLIKSDDCNS